MFSDFLCNSIGSIVLDYLEIVNILSFIVILKDLRNLDVSADYSLTFVITMPITVHWTPAFV